MHKTSLEHNPGSIEALKRFVPKAVIILDFTEHMNEKCPWPEISVKGRFF